MKLLQQAQVQKLVEQRFKEMKTCRTLDFIVCYKIGFSWQITIVDKLKSDFYIVVTQKNETRFFKTLDAAVKVIAKLSEIMDIDPDSTTCEVIPVHIDYTGILDS